MGKTGWAILFILGVSLSSFSTAATYGGGSGTAENPYQIWTPQQMNMIGANSADWGKCFKLMADINMSIYTGTQYKIIGNEFTKFTGTFDGGNYVIRNLTYSTIAGIQYVGVFGYVSRAAIITNTTVENVFISTNGSNVGGLVGYNDYGTIINCRVNGSVQSGASYIGGLVGRNFGILTGCSAAGTVNGSSSVGGLVGYNSFGTVNNSYAICSVNGTSKVGGLVGQSYYDMLHMCYTAGLSSGSTNVGGLVGSNEVSMVAACFWDMEASGLDNGVGSGSATGMTGGTTAQMQAQQTFSAAG
ncbi:MAG: hypothetical protein LLF76_00485 [Planctomycetaceae bacterium]|nr:hypothetical protein [Planctomycetaceae bacterium]